MSAYAKIDEFNSINPTRRSKIELHNSSDLLGLDALNRVEREINKNETSIYNIN